MRLRVVIGVVVLALGLAAVPAISSSNKRVHRVGIQVAMRTAYDARPLAGWLRQNGFDIAGLRKQKREIEVITDDQGLAKLRANRLNVRVIESRTEGLENTPPDARYLDPSKVSAKLSALARKFPSLTRLERIGTSTQGRPIEALLISTTPKEGDPKALAKPSVMFDGMHHAREIMTPEVVMDVADTLLGSIARRNERALKIVNDLNIWIIPMLNVDGNNIVWTEDNYWRKNAFKMNRETVGVDINRNYSYKFAACNGSSDDPSSDTFRGPSAGSEPETKALMGLAEQIRPAASISYHSFSELVLYPYGCSGSFSPENDLQKAVADELAKIIPTDTPGDQYTPGTPWQILYAVDGGSLDFLHAAYGTLAYVIEVNQEFQPPYELRGPTLEKQRKGWSYFLERSAKNMLSLQVVDGRTNRAIPAKITISTIRHQQGERDFQTNEGGYFHKVLDPGTYTVIATTGNGKQGKVTFQMTGKPNQQQIKIQ